MRKRILKKILLMVLIFVILFSFFNGYYIKVNAEDGVTPISAGTKVILPDESEVKQYGCATYEQEDISWYPGTGQEKVNKLWEAGGKLTDENNWAYIKTPDGVNRYLVAVTPLFGNAGDYLDIHTKDGKTIPCVMGDAKGNDSGGGVIGWYMYKGQPIGHKYDNGTCCVLEILLKDYNKIPSQDFLNSLNPVEWIQNGGSCLNGGMPVGLNNTYNFGTGGGSENIDGDDESETFLGALNMFFRDVWDSTATTFENSQNDRNDMTVLYDIKNLNTNKSSKNVSVSGFVQYYQGDYSDVAYGSSNIGNCGCGPTAFAMVASTILHKQITPADAVSWCGNTYYVWGEGTSWSYFPAAKEHFGVPGTMKETNSIDEVVNALKSGALVISSQGPGLFTAHGHFIVLAGIEGDNGIIVKDPNKNNAINKGYNDRKFTKSEIDAAAQNYWIFSY